MDTAEDIQHVERVATWRKMVSMKPNAQTAKRTLLNFQELTIYTKERERGDNFGGNREKI